MNFSLIKSGPMLNFILFWGLRGGWSKLYVNELSISCPVFNFWLCDHRSSTDEPWSNLSCCTYSWGFFFLVSLQGKIGEAGETGTKGFPVSSHIHKIIFIICWRDTSGPIATRIIVCIEYIVCTYQNIVWYCLIVDAYWYLLSTVSDISPENVKKKNGKRKTWIWAHFVNNPFFIISYVLLLIVSSVSRVSKGPQDLQGTRE